MGNNVRFLYNSFFDTASLTLASGALVDGWPLTNVQDSLIRKALKTDGNGNIVIQVDAGSEVYASGIGLAGFGTSLDPSCPVQVRAYSDAYITEIFSQGWEVIGPLIAWGEQYWGMFSTEGHPTAEDLVMYPNLTSLNWFDELTLARYWEIEIANGTTEDDEFYLGRILLGDYLEPEVNMPYGFSDKPVDPSKAHESAGGTEHFDLNPSYYQESFSLDYLSDFERDQFKKFCRYVGIQKGFMVQIENEDARSARLSTYYCRFLNNPYFQGTGHDLHTGKDFVLKEIVS